MNHIFFGCWNDGECNISTGDNPLSKVMKLITDNHITEKNIIYVLGDNYYPKKNKIFPVKMRNEKEFKSGFECLVNLPYERMYVLYGNHEYDYLFDDNDDLTSFAEKFDKQNSITLKGGGGCSLKYQLPYYSCKNIFDVDLSLTPHKILLINTNIYEAEQVKKIKDLKLKSIKSIKSIKSKKDKSEKLAKNTQKSYSKECLSDLHMTDIEKIQKTVIEEYITTEKDNYIICGHEPLITIRLKEDKIVLDYHSKLLELLNIKENKHIIYICADTHYYQHINFELENGVKVSQYIVGTGGTKLDSPYIGKIKKNVDIPSIITQLDIIEMRKTHGYLLSKDLKNFKFIGIDDAFVPKSIGKQSKKRRNKRNKRNKRNTRRKKGHRKNKSINRKKKNSKLKIYIDNLYR